MTGAYAVTSSWLVRALKCLVPISVRTCWVGLSVSPPVRSTRCVQCCCVHAVSAAVMMRAVLFPCSCGVRGAMPLRWRNDGVGRCKGGGAVQWRCGGGLNDGWSCIMPSRTVPSRRRRPVPRTAAPVLLHRCGRARRTVRVDELNDRHRTNRTGLEHPPPPPPPPPPCLPPPPPIRSGNGPLHSNGTKRSPRSASKRGPTNAVRAITPTRRACCRKPPGKNCSPPRRWRIILATTSP